MALAPATVRLGRWLARTHSRGRGTDEITQVRGGAGTRRALAPAPLPWRPGGGAANVRGSGRGPNTFGSPGLASLRRSEPRPPHRPAPPARHASGDRAGAGPGRAAPRWPGWRALRSPRPTLAGSQSPGLPSALVAGGACGPTPSQTPATLLTGRCAGRWLTRLAAAGLATPCSPAARHKPAPSSPMRPGAALARPASAPSCRAYAQPARSAGPGGCWADGPGRRPWFPTCQQAIGLSLGARPNLLPSPGQRRRPGGVKSSPPSHPRLLALARARRQLHAAGRLDWHSL